VDDKMDKVDKEDEDTEYKDDTDADDVDEDQYAEVKVDGDDIFVPEDEPDDNDEYNNDAVCDHEDNPDDVGEDKSGKGVKEIKVKKVNAFEMKWVNTYNDLMSFYNTNGNCRKPCRFVTVEGYPLVNWVHDQTNKTKRGHLTDVRINLMYDLNFEFSMQPNVVGAKLTVPVAIFKIFKYKKEKGNISIPNKDPYKQLHRWITHAKDASKKIIQEGNGNSNFTLPTLKLLNELGITQLPTNFKLKETATPKAAKKKETKKKMAKVPPKANAHGALARVSRVSVVLE
jgi:transcription initiation factor IIF auxiliary subunit